MEIISPIHGTIEYKDEDIITFRKGIPGFEEYTKYILKGINESSFLILQSLDNCELGFILASPFMVEEDYEIILTEELVKKINLKSPDEVVIYSIVTLNSDLNKATINLKAPLVINIKDNLGEQFIVDKEQYKIKHLLN